MDVILVVLAVLGILYAALMEQQDVLMGVVTG